MVETCQSGGMSLVRAVHPGIQDENRNHERNKRGKQRESERERERERERLEREKLLTRSQVRLERLEFPSSSGHRSLNERQKDLRSATRFSDTYNHSRTQRKESTSLGCSIYMRCE